MTLRWQKCIPFCRGNITSLSWDTALLFWLNSLLRSLAANLEERSDCLGLIMWSFLQASGKNLNLNDESQHGLLMQLLKLTHNCLNFDFIGTSTDESSDDLCTVQIPTSWRSGRSTAPAGTDCCSAPHHVCQMVWGTPGDPLLAFRENLESQRLSWYSEEEGVDGTLLGFPSLGRTFLITGLLTDVSLTSSHWSPWDSLLIWGHF